MFNVPFAGGRDTAGLGGKGGPYRLDAGHKVYQVSQAEKDAVPEEVRRAARDMAEQAFKDRCVHIRTHTAHMCTSGNGLSCTWRNSPHDKEFEVHSTQTATL